MGFGVEGKDDDGKKTTRSFDSAKELLEHKIQVICEEAWADDPPVLYLTNDSRLHSSVQRKRAKAGLPSLPYIPNFRVAVATTKPYKGTRKNEKPFHYDNLTAHIMREYNCKVATYIEADDLISIDHRLDPENTIICTRDKDLRITPGNHYGWQCGQTMGYGPMVITELGFLEKNEASGKVKGGGLMFFYYQMLVGDSVDNIPGLLRYGPKKAFDLLGECGSEEELFRVVSCEYEKLHEGKWREYYNEQATLLWMIQEINEDGSYAFHKIFDER